MTFEKAGNKDIRPILLGVCFFCFYRNDLFIYFSLSVKLPVLKVECTLLDTTPASTIGRNFNNFLSK